MISKEELQNLDVYALAGKYYQKIGEVWDHETKDFKVLYKPLYACGSKPGSFEAHHLAVSTFTRWESKFVKVDLCNLEDEVICSMCNSFVVSEKCVDEVSRGNDSLALTSVPFPEAMANASASVSVTITPRAVGTADNGNGTTKLCSSDSGYGTRSLAPYFTIDFDPRWQGMIRSGLKGATARVLNAGILGSEPLLGALATEVRTWKAGAVANPDSDLNLGSKGGVVVHAYSAPEKSTGGVGTIFATLRVYDVQTVSVAALTPELAAIEQFSTVEEFRVCLQGYYSSLTDDDLLHVFYFTVV